MHPVGRACTPCIAAISQAGLGHAADMTSPGVLQEPEDADDAAVEEEADTADQPEEGAPHVNDSFKLL